MPDSVFSHRIAALSLRHVKSPARRDSPYASLSFAPITVSPAHVNVAASAWWTDSPAAQSSSQSPGAGGGCQFFRTMSQRAPDLSR